VSHILFILIYFCGIVSTHEWFFTEFEANLFFPFACGLMLLLLFGCGISFHFGRFMSSCFMPPLPRRYTSESALKGNLLKALFGLATASALIHTYF
jgi:hypothetical protein